MGLVINAGTHAGSWSISSNMLHSSANKTRKGASALLKCEQTPSPTQVYLSNPSSTPCSQGSPLTQNPLLSALLFAKKPNTMREKPDTMREKPDTMREKTLSPLPDLQYYLDLLEAQVPESPSAPLVDIRENNNYLLHERQRENMGVVFGTLPPTPPNSGSTELLQMRKDTMSDFTELSRPLTQSLLDTTKFKQTISGSEELAQSFLDRIMHSSPLDNLNQLDLTACEETLSIQAQREICPDHSRTLTTAHTHEFTQKNSSHTLPCFADGTTLFRLESSTEHVDLDTSLYGNDTFSTSQSEAEDTGCIQSENTELFDLSLLSDVEEVQSSAFQPYGMAAIPSPITQNTPPVAVCSPRTELEPSSQPCSPARRSGHRRNHHGDDLRARALHLPLSVDDIVSLSADAFNDAISTFNELSRPQLSLMREIRRRGKNKAAAQNCRKRKLDKMVDLEAEVKALREKSEWWMRERENNVRALCEAKQKLKKLYREVFSQLRDESGNPYSPKEYTLQHSSDGRVYLLPRPAHVN